MTSTKFIKDKYREVTYAEIRDIRKEILDKEKLGILTNRELGEKISRVNAILKILKKAQQERKYNPYVMRDLSVEI